MTKLDDLKLGNEAPSWMTENGYRVLQTGYLFKGETPVEMYERLARTAADKLLEMGWEEDLGDKFFDIMWKGWLGPATPVASNLGTPRGLPISCYSSYMEDSINGIFGLVKEVAHLSANGGGCAAHISDVRPTGAAISGGGISTGIIPWMKVLDSTIHAVNQCYDSETEILTEKGWKLFKHLEEEKVAQVIPLRGGGYGVEFVTPEKVALNYEGLMYLLDGPDKYVSLAVTPNHKLAIQNVETGNLSLYQVDTVEFNESNGHPHGIPRTSRIKDLVNQVTFKEVMWISSFTDLLGINIRQGTGGIHVFNSRKGSTSKVEEYKEEKANQLFYLIKFLAEREGFKVETRSASMMIKTEGPFSLVPPLLEDAEQRERITAFLYYYGEMNRHETLCSGDEECINHLQALLTLEGVTTRVCNPKNTHYCLFADFERNYTCGSKLELKQYQYSGMVYSVEVPSGVVIVRREGCVSVSGNSGLRKGAIAVYCDIEHPDIEDFLRVREKQGDPNLVCGNIHHAVCIGDSFMERVKSKEPEATRLWLDVLNTRAETGEPYLFFKDNANRLRPQWYKDNNLEYKGSNLCCLRGEEKVVTKEGDIAIKDLVDKTVHIWDGEGWVENSSFKSKGFTEELLRITTTNGNVLDVTPNHRIPLEIGWCFANQLLPGHKIKTHHRVLSFEVMSVEEIQLEEAVEVFCCEVPSTSFFALANGMMTGNSEILQHTDALHTLVCCLSSMNATKYQEWKGTDAVKLAIYFLDAVMQVFIDKASKMEGMERAVRSATKGRSLGLGVLGYHSLLQSKGIPFDSKEAERINGEMFAYVDSEAKQATKELALVLGEPEWCKGYGRRNAHLTAVAPTVSNSMISGEGSPGIEPIGANYLVKGTAAGTVIYKNPILVEYLESVNMNVPEVWESINDHKGSVQHLEFIPDTIKDIFKTAREINQMAIIKQAAQRQPFIEQTQSVNLFFKDIQEVGANQFSKIHYYAYHLGLPTLYYCRSTSKAANYVNKIEMVNSSRNGKVDNKEVVMQEGAVCTMEEGCITCQD